MESITINYIYNSNVQEEKKDDDILIHKWSRGGKWCQKLKAQSQLCNRLHRQGSVGRERL